MQSIFTDRLEIRRFTDADTEPYADIMTKPEVSRYLGAGNDIPRERALTSVQRWNSVCDSGYGVYAVVERSGGKLIGHCGIRPIPDGRIELLYAYDPCAWGKGYATEAGRAVLEYGKKNFEFTELIAMSYPQNAGSIGVIKKLGFEPVGQEEHFGKMLDVFVLRKNIIEYRCLVDRIYSLHDKIKDLDASLECLYPIAIVDNNVYYVFDVGQKGNSYEFILQHPAPAWLPDGVMAAFPLDFYDDKIAAIISAKELANPDNDVTVYHEFVHCYQWDNFEQKIKQKLAIAKQNLINPMWEIDHPFSYEDDVFVSSTTELNDAKQLDVFKKYHEKMKKHLSVTDFEYMVWQEWKEGYARYAENLIRENQLMKKNTQDLLAPYDRVSFYEIGSRYIELLIKNDDTLKMDLEKLFYTMSGES